MEVQEKMENFFVSSCKRMKRKMLRKWQQRENCSMKLIRLADGGEVVEWGLGLLAREARQYDSQFCRIDMSQLQTNIQQELSCSLKSMERDYVLEKLLQSGDYSFEHMLLIRNPYGEAPLTALVLFALEQEAEVRVTTKGDVPETDFVSVLPKKRYHRVPVLGLYPNRENQVQIELLDEAGQVIKSHTIPVNTPELPATLDGAITKKKAAKDPAFENILINGGMDIHTCAFDREGEIRYYLRRKPKGYGVFPMTDGHFIYAEKGIALPSFSNPQAMLCYDMDYFGRVHRTYLVKSGVHHAAEEKAGGNILAASCTMDKGVEDRVIEIDRETGEIVWDLDIWTLFDDTYKDRKDWCHLNSIAYYEKDRSVILSLRNVHAVLCVDYDTKKLRWMLSDPEFWKDSSMTEYLLQPQGDVPWFYQQHAAFDLTEEMGVTSGEKRVIVYDNHWAKRRKAKSFDKDPLSYVCFYDIDEEKRTVHLHKRIGGPKSKIRSNGIYVPGKNRVYNMAGDFPEPIDGNIGGIYEHDYESGELLSEYLVRPGFFRAYEYEPNVTELAEPLAVTGSYQCGETKRPVKIKKDLYETLAALPVRRLRSSYVDYAMQEDLLLIRNIDHEIERVCFFGEKERYQVDFSDTYQTMDVFVDSKYYIPMQLDQLPPDRYQLFLKIGGELQKTGKYIEIKAANED
jgi:hypothetical protein